MLPFTLLAERAMAQDYLDNVNQSDTLINPGDGVWAAASEIWLNVSSFSYDVLAEGRTGILRVDTVNGPSAVTLTISGTVLPGRLDVRAGDFTLTGGTIGKEDRDLALEVADGLTLDVNSSLAGFLAVEGAGTVQFSGDGGALQSVRIDDGATLDSSGTTAGDLTAEGQFNLTGEHDGAVSILDDGFLTGTGTIAGSVENDGTAVFAGSAGSVTNSGDFTANGDLSALTLTNAANAEFAQAAGTTLTIQDDRIRNSGTMALSGTVDMAETDGQLGLLLNSSGAVLSLDGATINGSIWIQDGSQLDAQAANGVGGNLRINGDLIALGDTRVDLNIDGNFVMGSGQILQDGEGRLAISARSLEFLADSIFDNAVAVLTGPITNRGQFTISTAMTLAGDFLNATGPGSAVGTVRVRAAVDADGYDVTNNGTFLLEAGANRNGSLVDVGTLTNAGSITTAAGTSITAGSVILAADSTMRHAGSLTGDVVAREDASLTLNGGTISGDLENDGEVAGRGAVAGTLTNNEAGVINVTGSLSTGGLANAGVLTIGSDGSLTTAGSFTNEGVITASGDLVLTGGGSVLTNAADARLTLAGGQITGSIVNNADGEVRVTEDTSVTGDITNSGAIRMTVSSDTVDLTVEGGTFTNLGQIEATSLGSFRVIADQIILKAGSLVSGPVAFLGEVQNAGELLFTDDMILTGDLLNQAGGVLRVLADVDANGFSVTNRGAMTVGSDPRGTVTDITALTNSGRFTVEDDTEVAAETVTNEAGGTFRVQGTVVGAFGNAAGGIVTLDGGMIEGGVANLGTVNGSGTITGALKNNAVATIAGGVVGAVDNSGTLTTAGNLSVASLSNSQRVIVAAGHTLTTGSAVENAADMDVLGRVAGAVDNANGASLTLDAGAVTGSVTNRGSMTADGTIGRTLTNNGSLSTTGNLTVGSLVNAGTATVGSGDVLTAGGGVRNTGAVQMLGTVRGNLDNAAGGTTTLAASSRIEGSVENSGTLMGRTTITGDVTNAAQAALGGSTGDLTNTSTGTLQARGTLEVGALGNAGTLIVADSQRLTAREGLDNSGTVDLRGTLQANGSGIANSEGATIALDGATVIGTTVNEGLLDIRSDSSFVGDLTNRGTIDLTGTAANVLVTVSDGTFRNSGTVQVSGEGFLTIQADDILLDATSNVDNSRVALIGSLSNEGSLVFRRDVDLAGDLVNADTGQITVLAAVDAQGNDVTNGGEVRIGAPSGSLTGVGTLTNDDIFVVDEDGTVGADTAVNRDGGQMTIAGTMEANDIRNDAGGTLRSTGTLSGDLTNAGSAVLSGTVGDVVNSGRVVTGGNLLAGAMVNEGSLTVAASHVLTPSQTVINSGTLQVDGRLTGGLETSGRLIGAGRIGGGVVNSGAMTWTGGVDGSVVNSSVARLAGSIGGNLRNTGNLDLTADLDVAGAVVNEVDGNGDATLSVGRGMVLTVADGIENRAGAVMQNDGRIVGDLTNFGNYSQTGILGGSLTTTGSADLSGRVAGNVTFDAGSLTLGQGMKIDGTLSLGQDFTLATGGRLTTGRTITAEDATFTLGGRLTGSVDNAGTLAVVSDARIDGTLTNTGVVDLTGDSSTQGSLLVNGLSGTGEYKLDVDLGNMTADSIVVRGAAATGHYALTLNEVTPGTVGEIGRSVTVIDVDERLGAANAFTFDPVDFSVGSERIVYDLRRQADDGDLAIVSITNPAIGALAGNVSLTQTLIDSVVNRPTSPFVTGLAYEDAEKPCGPGTWGRTTGGSVESEGAFATDGEQLNSSVDATYYGLQLGGDIACFDDRYSGWNLAFGVVGGVNQGSASQPVSITLQGVSRQTSVNETEFTQVYGGVYMTATKDRWQADLQFRGERTDFTVENRSLVGGVGLGLTDAEFKSISQTISGSVSYAMPVGKTDWTFVPTAGFALSRIQTDDLRFDAIEEGITETLKFDDAQRKIGFLGATVARSYVQPEQNSALQVFATGTVYHDFAEPSVSIFTREGDDLMDPQRIESDNLGTYSELSIGANYLKVLGEGSRARQFSTSARIDARFGESLDSVGVTAQVRWQF